METVGKKQSDWTVLWQEERRTLSLQGEPVLDYTLSRPLIQAGGQGGRRVDRYYQRLAEVWRRRWDRALYWQSCLDLARCRDLGPVHSSPGRPVWRAGSCFRTKKV